MSATLKSTCLSARLFSTSRMLRALQSIVTVTGVVALLLATSGVIHGAPINYGSFMGNTVTYVDVTENSATDPQHFPPNAFPPDPNAGLFGKPVVSGDSLDFTPINFFAISELQAPPFDQTDGHLTFMVVAKPLKAITNINFEEGGSLRVSGFGTDTTRVDASAIGILEVNEVDGVPINVVKIDINLGFNYGVLGNGTWRLVSEGIVNGFLWKGAQFIDIKQELINRNVPVIFGATKITVALDNSLYAESELLSGAFIDKKDFGGLNITVNIPEPGTLALAGCALLAGVFYRRGR